MRYYFSRFSAPISGLFHLIGRPELGYSAYENSKEKQIINVMAKDVMVINPLVFFASPLVVALPVLFEASVGARDDSVVTSPVKIKALLLAADEIILDRECKRL